MRRKTQSPWRNIDIETPKADGDYITLLQKVDGPNIIIEIAPWRRREYHGTYHAACFFNCMKVTHWMPIPELPKEITR